MNLPLTYQTTIANARAEILKELAKGKIKTSAVTLALCLRVKKDWQTPLPRLIMVYSQ